MKNCPKCQAQLSDNATFCGNCGTKLDAVQNPQPQQPQDFQQASQPQQPQGFQQAPQPQQPQGFQQAPQPQQPQGFQQASQPQQPQGFQQAPQYQQPHGFQQAPQYQQQPYQGGYQQPFAQQQKRDDGKGLSIAALVLGICGLVVPWVGTICAILGIIFGVIGRAKSVACYNKASGLATAGLVCGIVGAAFAVMWIVVCTCPGALCSACASSAYYW